MGLWLAMASAAGLAVNPPMPANPEGHQPVPISAPENVEDLPPEIADLLVKAKVDYHKRMTVPVTIEGKGPFHFMIDTGAQATVVSRGITASLALEPAGKATVVGMGGRKLVDLVRVDGLEFAERTFDNIEAPMLNAADMGADGILGLDSLQDMRVLIDFRANTIAVNDASALGGNRGYEIIVRARHKLGRLIITQADIDGVRTAVILDTGAQGSFGNARLQRRLRARKAVEVNSRDVLGTQITGDLHFAKALQIQGLQLNNLPITFADSPAFAALGLEKRPALILGMRDLRLFDRVAIDFASRRVLFDVPSGAYGRGLYRDSYMPSRIKHAGDGG